MTKAQEKERDRKEIETANNRKRLMAQVAAVARRMGLPAALTPEDIRRESKQGRFMA